MYCWFKYHLLHYTLLCEMWQRMFNFMMLYCIKPGKSFSYLYDIKGFPANENFIRGPLSYDTL